MCHSLTQSSEISSYSSPQNEWNQGKTRNQSKSGLATTARNYNAESQEDILQDWKGAIVELFFCKKKKKVSLDSVT